MIVFVINILIVFGIHLGLTVWFWFRIVYLLASPCKIPSL